MQNPANMRKLATRCFGAIGAGSAVILIVAMVWLALRVDERAFSHIVLIVGSALFAIVGLTVWFAVKFNRECAAMTGEGEVQNPNHQAAE